MSNVEVQAFLRQFFARPANELAPADLTADGGAWSAFAPMLARLAGPARPPLVLPRVRRGRITIYGCAFDGPSLRLLRDDLLASVGPSWSTFRGHGESLDAADPVEAAVDALTGGRALKFRTNEAERPGLTAAVGRMAGLWAARPPPTHDVPGPAARVLRDFFMALEAGNRASAEQHMDALRAGDGALSSLNLSFLRLQLLDRFGRAADFLDDPALPDVLHHRRPPAVTEALLQGVYDRHLAQFEAGRDAAGAMAAFRLAVLLPYGPLLVSHRGMRRPAALKTFALLAACSAPARAELFAEVLAQRLDPGDAAYVQLLAGLAAPPPVVVVAPVLADVDPLVRARDALDEGDSESAFRLAAAAGPSVARATLLCRAAYELDALDACRTALDAVAALAEADRLRFLAVRVNRDVFEQLQRGTATPAAAAPTDVLQWFAQLNAAALADPAGSAFRGTGEWDFAPFASDDPAPAARLAALARAPRPPAAEQALADALPHLLAYFRSDERWPRLAFADVYRLLTDTLYLTTAGAGDDLDAFALLLGAELAVGPDAAVYADRLGLAVDLTAKFAAPATLDRFLDLLDAVVAHPCPTPAARADRDRLATAVADAFRGHARRVLPAQRALLLTYFDELGLAPAVADLAAPAPAAAAAGEPAAAADPLLALAGRSVGIYSLHVSAARRVGELLQRRVPRVQVRLNDAKVCTTQLQEMARQCDVVVMVTWASKHAATGCILSHRPDGLPTLTPNHRGSSSILAALYDYGAGAG